MTGHDQTKASSQDGHECTFPRRQKAPLVKVSRPYYVRIGLDLGEPATIDHQFGVTMRLHRC